MPESGNVVLAATSLYTGNGFTVWVFLIGEEHKSPCLIEICSLVKNLSCPSVSEWTALHIKSDDTFKDFLQP